MYVIHKDVAAAAAALLDWHDDLNKMSCVELR
jgi:hypothetical protein